MSVQACCAELSVLSCGVLYQQISGLLLLAVLFLLAILLLILGFGSAQLFVWPFGGLDKGWLLCRVTAA